MCIRDSADPERGLGQVRVSLAGNSLELLAAASKGDARMALNILESLVDSFQENNTLEVTPELIKKVVGPVSYTHLDVYKRQG